MASLEEAELPGSPEPKKKIGMFKVRESDVCSKHYSSLSRCVSRLMSPKGRKRSTFKLNIDSFFEVWLT